MTSMDDQLPSDPNLVEPGSADIGPEPAGVAPEPAPAVPAPRSTTGWRLSRLPPVRIVVAFAFVLVPQIALGKLARGTPLIDLAWFLPSILLVHLSYVAYVWLSSGARPRSWPCASPRPAWRSAS